MKNIQNGKTLLVKQMVERAINVTTNFSQLNNVKSKI